MEQKTGFMVGRNYTNKKIEKILELPFSWHKDNHTGDTIDKVQKSRGAIDVFSEHYTSTIMYSLIDLFGSTIILFLFDPLVALIALALSMIIIGIIILVDKKVGKLYDEANKLENKLSSSIFDYLNNIQTVITLRLKKTVLKEVDKRSLDVYLPHKKAAHINEFKWAFASISLMTMTAGLLIFRSYTEYNSTGTIMIGSLYILYGYLKIIGNTFFRFASNYTVMVEYSSRINNAKPIDDEFESLKRYSGSNLPLNWREIKIRGLNFSYKNSDSNNHLENINFQFKRGEKIALVGESGSGKSTLLLILRGLHQPESGKIYSGDDFISGGFSKLKHSVTLIPQDPEIFNSTINYNISMDLGYSKSEILEAVNLAQFEKVLNKLPKGLDTNVLEKGVSLSGGEKQRLALARGILAAKKSDIVLLDEPTSSVDSLNEKKIHENLFDKFRDKTIISSIHRLHLLDKFDKIYFFENGRIVESGSFEKLKRNPKFRNIWRKYNEKNK